MRPLLVDLYCKAGGASKGYVDAGFDVIGVDIEPQPHYPWEFHQADAIEFLRAHGMGFHAAHASPPCQKWTKAQSIRGREHPDLIAATRHELFALDLPYVIENVVGSPLIDPVELCGVMFPQLRVYRHRLFESSFVATAPVHGKHTVKLARLGREPWPDEYIHVVGNFTGVAFARTAMGLPWMNQAELREAIPPAYTEYLGRQLLDQVRTRPAPERPFYRRDVVVHG